MAVIRKVSLMLLAVSAPWTTSGYVCQVLTEEGASLQDLLGIQCTVALGFCNCSSSYINGASWLFVSQTVNESMRYHAEPGEWYVMDPSGRCAMGIGNSTLQPTPQPCPPGFYCAGELSPPRSCSSGDHCPARTAVAGRRCPSGFFCPTPSSSLMKCPDGAHCAEGSTRPDACEAGFYCRNGFTQECPRGSYCPFGSKEPRSCEVFARCPPGTKSQGVAFNAAFLLSFCVGLALASAHFYDHIVNHSWEACALCAGLVALMWVVDNIIAGYLSLLLAVVTANWALLQIGTCPPVAARLVLLVTVSVAILLVGVVNPPWSMLAGGLVVCASLGWLMSRQNFMVVLIGRVLLLVSFGVLLVVYFFIDPHFTLVIAGLFLLLFCGLLTSWLCERRRQRQRVALPFLTRWRFRASLGSFAGPGEGDVTMDLWGASRQSATHGEQAGARPGPKSAGPALDHGISFCLQEVSFDLLDGKRLLRDVSLNMASGRRVAVMGPSGSGKSTLLAVLSGRASYGQVIGRLQVGGHAADDLRFLQHVTGFVPQDDVLHGELTVEENIRFQAALRLPEGTSAEEVASQVGSIAADLGINRILRERVGTPERRGVSGGQRKRVSIAMELVANPLLLFADEPTSGLDSTTSHDVVRCLNEAAARLGTTVIAVIHQPRYETLRLFDDLVLLGTGGCLVYAGPTAGAMEHFQQRLRVSFPANTNPADVLLDAIQPPRAEDFAETWRTCTDLPVPAAEVPHQRFYRQRPPFFRAVLIYMDRAILQSLRTWVSLAVSQSLCVATTCILCIVIQYERLDQFVMQSAFAALFLMLLQGVAAQRIFGADLLTIWREARVGMPMVAYLVAKDLAALFEISLSAAVFTAAYGSMSGAQLELHRLYAGTWAFIYTTFGLNYIFSIILSASAAQMSAVVSSFIGFCVAGVYQPQLPEIVQKFNGRGWMIPALSPIRWLFGFLLTEESNYLTDIARQGSEGTLKSKGYDLKYLEECTSSVLGVDESVSTLQQAWEDNRGWVCSTAPLLLLGLIFRFLAGLCLMLYVHAQTSGWARFFARSNAGAWKLAGHLFTLLVGSFLAVFLFAEIWTFGILNVDGARPTPSPHF